MIAPDRLSRHVGWVLGAVLFALLTSCGSEVAQNAIATPSALTATERDELVELAVSAEQIPPLSKTSKSLTIDDVVAQADVPDLRDALESAGFKGGLKLEYRGVSPRLTGVESQVLAFSSDAGAASFSEYLAEHAGAFFGEPITVAPIVVAGRDGWRFDPPVCDCAGAQPLSAGAAQVGPNLAILQITGPEADAAMMRRLLTTVLRDAS